MDVSRADLRFAEIRHLRGVDAIDLGIDSCASGTRAMNRPIPVDCHLRALRIEVRDDSSLGHSGRARILWAHRNQRGDNVKSIP